MMPAKAQFSDAGRIPTESATIRVHAADSTGAGWARVDVKRVASRAELIAITALAADCSDLTNTNGVPKCVATISIDAADSTDAPVTSGNQLRAGLAR